jgi:hypothetical protein
MAGTLEDASDHLVEETNNLSKSAPAIVKAIDSMVKKLESLQTPEQVIEIKVAPMIQGLTRSVNSFAKSAEAHEKAVDKTLKQTQNIAIAVAQLVEKLQAAEAGRSDQGSLYPGPWGEGSSKTAIK